MKCSFSVSNVAQFGCKCWRGILQIEENWMRKEQSCEWDLKAKHWDDLLFNKRRTDSRYHWLNAIKMFLQFRSANHLILTAILSFVSLCSCIMSRLKKLSSISSSYSLASLQSLVWVMPRLRAFIWCIISWGMMKSKQMENWISFWIIAKYFPNRPRAVCWTFMASCFVPVWNGYFAIRAVKDTWFCLPIINYSRRIFAILRWKWKKRIK